MKKKAIEYIVKAIVYIAMAICTYFGISAFTSCTVNRQIQTKGNGIGVFHYTDTFRVNHGQKISIKYN